MIRLLLAVLFLVAMPRVSFSHDIFTDKYVQVPSEWTAAQYGGYGGPGGMYQYEAPPPLRPGEEWLDGKTKLSGDNASCCNGRDCWEIEDTEWWQRDGAYWVTRLGKVYAIAAGRAQPSESKTGKAAACIHDGELLCFFVPVTY
jgi:hypothetical protein